MEDDHVDRPGVDVQQCMKLTGTNRPIGLIVLIDHAHQALLDDAKDLCPDAVASFGCCAADGPPNDWRRPLACMGASSARRVRKGSNDVFKD